MDDHPLPRPASGSGRRSMSNRTASNVAKMKDDLDSSGMMHIIQALIKPPAPDDDPPSRSGSKHKPPNAYYKRPGVGHNHDTCDACDEGGDLICCDRCPSSFHLGCHDPPLDKHHIPAGIWLCHHCRMTKPSASTAAAPRKTMSLERRPSGRNSGDNSSTSTSSRSAPSSLSSTPIVVDESRPATPAVVCVDLVDTSTNTSSSTDVNPMELVRRMRKRCASTTPLSVSSDSSETVMAVEAASPEVIDVDDLYDETEESAAAAANAAQGLDELIRAATILNPKQFELPRELNIYVQFPGSDRIEPCLPPCAKKPTRANGEKKKPHELDSHGLVPLPAKTCFYCRRSCKRAALVACDYCPSYFHTDCLDPPLAALPAGLWMCPNHPQQLIDWKLVQSISATERVRLWNRFIEPVDQDTVKAEFFRKVHAANPPFRFKRRLVQRMRVHVPPMVVYHYMHPASLLPSLRDVLRCETVFQRRGQALLDDRALARLLEAEQEPLRRVDDVDDKNEDTDDATEGTMTVDNDDDADDDDEDAVIDNNVAAKAVVGRPEATKQPTPPPPTTTETTTTTTTTATSTSPATAGAVRTNTNSGGGGIEALELGHLDAATIKRLAYQRLQQLCDDNPALVETYQRQSTATAIQETLQRAPASKRSAAKPLPSQLLTRADIERIAREFTTSPASGRRTAPEIIDDALLHGGGGGVNRQCCHADGAVQLNGFDALRTDAEKTRELAQRLVQPLRESRVRARALLLPVDDVLAGRRWFTKASMDGAVYMRYRQLTVGAGPGNDVPLRADVCARVSGKHAVIFFDDVTGSYELLNYSEFGTEINGQLFSCDLTEYAVTPAATFKKPADIRTPSDDPKSFYASIRQIVDKRRGIRRPELDELEAERQRMEAAPQPACECRTRPPLIHGWEGTAILNHGSLVRFGCVPYMFAIVDR